jgi:hypothetical protein
MATSSLPIPVSPRDNHIIHGETIQKLLTTLLTPLLEKSDTSGPTQKIAELNINHLGEHLQFAAATDAAKSPQFKELQKFYDGFKGQLAQVAQITAQASAAQQMVTEQIRQEDAPATIEENASAPTGAPVPVLG